MSVEIRTLLVELDKGENVSITATELPLNVQKELFKIIKSKREIEIEYLDLFRNVEIVPTISEELLNLYETKLLNSPNNVRNFKKVKLACLNSVGLSVKLPKQNLGRVRLLSEKKIDFTVELNPSFKIVTADGVRTINLTATLPLPKFKVVEKDNS